MGKSDYCRRCGTVASKLAPGCWPCRIQLALLEVCAVPLIRITKDSTFIGIAMQQCTGIAPRIQLTLNSAKAMPTAITVALS